MTKYKDLYLTRLLLYLFLWLKRLAEITPLAEYQVRPLMSRNKDILQLVLAGPSPPVRPAHLPATNLPGLPRRDFEVEEPQGARQSQTRLHVGHCLSSAGAIADEERDKGLAHIGAGRIFLGVCCYPCCCCCRDAAAIGKIVQPTLRLEAE